MVEEERKRRKGTGEGLKKVEEVGKGGSTKLRKTMERRAKTSEVSPLSTFFWSATAAFIGDSFRIGVCIVVFERIQGIVIRL